MPYVYVKADDYEKADAFYHDISNFDYYIGKLYEDPVRVEDETLFSGLEDALNLTSRSNDQEKKEINDLVYSDSFVIYRYSKDGLFCRGNGPQFVLYEQRFYCFLLYDGSEEKTILGVISDQMNAFLIDLYNRILRLWKFDHVPYIISLTNKKKVL